MAVQATELYFMISSFVIKLRANLTAELSTIEINSQERKLTKHFSEGFHSTFFASSELELWMINR